MVTIRPDHEFLVQQPRQQEVATEADREEARRLVPDWEPWGSAERQRRGRARLGIGRAVIELSPNPLFPHNHIPRDPGTAEGDPVIRRHVIQVWNRVNDESLSSDLCWLKQETGSLTRFDRLISEVLNSWTFTRGRGQEGQGQSDRQVTVSLKSEATVLNQDQFTSLALHRVLQGIVGSEAQVLTRIVRSLGCLGGTSPICAAISYSDPTTWPLFDTVYTHVLKRVPCIFWPCMSHPLSDSMRARSARPLLILRKVIVISLFPRLFELQLIF